MQSSGFNSPSQVKQAGANKNDHYRQDYLEKGNAYQSQITKPWSVRWSFLLFTLAVSFCLFSLISLFSFSPPGNISSRFIVEFSRKIMFIQFTANLVRTHLYFIK